MSTPNIPVVYAMGSQSVHLPAGATVRVAKGQHWPASDPVVLAAPQLFSTDPRWGMAYTVEPDGYDAPVETATSVPGERRTTRRTP